MKSTELLEAMLAAEEQTFMAEHMREYIFKQELITVAEHNERHAKSIVNRYPLSHDEAITAAKLIGKMRAHATRLSNEEKMEDAELVLSEALANVDVFDRDPFIRAAMEINRRAAIRAEKTNHILNASISYVNYAKLVADLAAPAEEDITTAKTFMKKGGKGRRDKIDKAFYEFNRGQILHKLSRSTTDAITTQCHAWKAFTVGAKLFGKDLTTEYQEMLAINLANVSTAIARLEQNVKASEILREHKQSIPEDFHKIIEDFPTQFLESVKVNPQVPGFEVQPIWAQLPPVSEPTVSKLEYARSLCLRAMANTQSMRYTNLVKNLADTMGYLNEKFTTDASTEFIKAIHTSGEGVLEAQTRLKMLYLVSLSDASEIQYLCDTATLLFGLNSTLSNSEFNEFISEDGEQVRFLACLLADRGRPDLGFQTLEWLRSGTSFNPETLLSAQNKINDFTYIAHSPNGTYVITAIGTDGKTSYHSESLPDLNGAVLSTLFAAFKSPEEPPSYIHTIGSTSLTERLPSISHLKASLQSLCTLVNNNLPERTEESISAIATLGYYRSFPIASLLNESLTPSSVRQARCYSLAWSLHEIVEKGDAFKLETSAFCDASSVTNAKFLRYAALDQTHVRRALPGTAVIAPLSAEVDKQLDEVSLFIFSGHSVLGADKNMGALVLEDGLFSEVAVRSRNTEPAVVILSSCEAAQSFSPYTTEFTHGLQEAFYHSGAQIVAAPFWPIKDIAGSVYVALVCRRLKESIPTTSSQMLFLLISSQLELRDITSSEIAALLNLPGNDSFVEYFCKGERSEVKLFSNFSEWGVFSILGL